jgi:hypothetical protein
VLALDIGHPAVKESSDGENPFNGPKASNRLESTN